MEIHSTNKLISHHHSAPPPPPPTLTRRAKLLLTVLNCLLLSVGNCSGPIFLRIYYLHGGRRIWLTSFLETAGFPLLLIPLSISYLHRRRSNPSTPLLHLTPRLLLASSVLGVITGLDDFLYSYGLNFLPVSTSSVLIASQLAFTAIFAFLIVRQKFTPFSVNAVALLTIGAVILALHTSGDRPAGVTAAGYWKGFVLTIGAAALYGLFLPLVELTYDKLAGRAAVTYTLVMEMQLVIGFFATGFCAVGMIVNKDFQAIPREAAEYGLGETKYYLVIIAAAIFWQCFFLGAIGVIFCVNTLLSGIIIAVFIPVIEVLAFIFLHENFSSEKGVALLLSLWGLASYSYGEYRQAQEKKKELQPAPALSTV
ncbi:purine permease 3-like isoform X1 [Dendrobium catenatum]|uniref:purine permease 3-like isoform X1 n=1 Tax=Dendrobium catenatum TaxID=906689 RepID=UPI00109F1BBF|nr:purine permease 3-like isoform X1 [Dendrobium catenatum]